MRLDVEKEAFPATVMRHIRPAHTVLDIGCGISPQRLTAPVVHICVEPHRSYVDRLMEDLSPGMVVLACEWDECLRLLPPRSVDSVFLIDVIEHLEKEEALRLLDATVALARGQVVIKTPVGFFPQCEGAESDNWGLDGVERQIHRSGWLPEEFDGWLTIACPDWIDWVEGREPQGMFYAILDKGAGLLPAEDSRIAELVSAYEQSSSWRLTKPLRKIGAALKSGRSRRALTPPSARG